MSNIFSETVMSSTATEFRVRRRNSSSRISNLIIICIFILCIITIYISTHYNHISFWCVLVAASSIALVLNSMFVVEESVTIVKRFGIQLTFKRRMGNEIKMFVDREKIKKVFIHEYVSGTSVNYCLGLAVVGEDRLILAFDKLYPGLTLLQTVFRQCATEFPLQIREES